MMALAIDSVLTGRGLRASGVEETISSLTAGLIVRSIIPVIWLGFSLTYSRTNYREFLTRWTAAFVVVGLVPIGFSIAFRDQLFHVVSVGEAGRATIQPGELAKALHPILLVAVVFILLNL